jgi:methionyl aminopeptidase
MTMTAEMNPPVRTGEIRRYGPEGFEGMRRAGELAARALDMLVAEVKEGVETRHLDRLVREFAFDHGAAPATLNYRGYRYSSCISLNHVVCHGMPGTRRLAAGDILNIDVTLLVDGWHGDTSRMYAVPPVKRRAERLMEVTHEALMAGIAAVRPGNRFADIARAIQPLADLNRLSVVEDFCGHGVGRVFHDEPNVVHAWPRLKPADAARAYAESPELLPGMIFTIEPMLNAGRKEVAILPDGWTAVTRDRQLSAQFEHSVGVTETGCEVFTLSPAGLHTPFTLALTPGAPA